LLETITFTFFVHPFYTTPLLRRSVYLKMIPLFNNPLGQPRVSLIDFVPSSRRHSLGLLQHHQGNSRDTCWHNNTQARPRLPVRGARHRGASSRAGSAAAGTDLALVVRFWSRPGLTSWERGLGHGLRRVAEPKVRSRLACPVKAFNLTFCFTSCVLPVWRWGYMQVASGVGREVGRAERGQRRPLLVSFTSSLTLPFRRGILQHPAASGDADAKFCIRSRRGLAIDLEGHGIIETASGRHRHIRRQPRRIDVGNA
jgi:hypothetical protein